MRDRRAREAEGRKAEDHVSRWLKLRGWTVLANRFKVSEGEVDIIARKKTVIAFVEVKQREVLPKTEDVVTATNVQRLIAAAEIWVEQNFDSLGLDFEIRFDLALIQGRVHPITRVQYIENAFTGL